MNESQSEESEDWMERKSAQGEVQRRRNLTSSNKVVENEIQVEQKLEAKRFG